MSNALHASVTSSHAVPHVDSPASASASALTTGECNVETYTPPGAADWAHLLEERVAIMRDSGIPEERAQALAREDVRQMRDSLGKEAP